MMMVRERIDKWTEDSGMLGEIQGGFRRGRCTEDNLFMLERLIEMVKGRKEEVFMAFLDMEKAYDRVNRKKLFEGCGALAWYQRGCDYLEVIQNGFGRWVWEVGNVRNGLVRGESGWSSFAEREVKCIVDWMLRNRIVYEESLVSDIGRACL